MREKNVFFYDTHGLFGGGGGGRPGSGTGIDAAREFNDNGALSGPKLK